MRFFIIFGCKVTAFLAINIALSICYITYFSSKSGLSIYVSMLSECRKSCEMLFRKVSNLKKRNLPLAYVKKKQ